VQDWPFQRDEKRTKIMQSACFAQLLFFKIPPEELISSPPMDWIKFSPESTKLPKPGLTGGSARGEDSRVELVLGFVVGGEDDAIVGLTLGLIVGKKDGANVGFVEGLGVGKDVGFGVGRRVGR
jgi:hypothetical protein